ncbi:MAG TPA: YgaP-like transmembrane domain [Chthoniobacterales bacterium]|nr:YgaP-like transmembrane domain [Chthoniobacterales bacterium]
MKQNIDSGGRVARGGISVICLLGAGVLGPYSAPLAVIFLLFGLFTMFEAVRGWCAVRACGIKTPF